MAETVIDITDNRPNHQLIEHLKDLLLRAKAGEIRSFYNVCQYSNNHTSCGWVLDNRSDKRAMLAGMVMSQHEFVVNIELFERTSILYDELNK